MVTTQWQLQQQQQTQLQAYRKVDDRHQTPMPTLRCCHGKIFTGRNEVLAKVIFLHLFVILFTGGGVPDQVHPPGTRYPPRDQVHPPRTRYTPRDQVPPQDQVPPPPGPGTPPSPSGTRSPPCPPAGTRYTPPPGCKLRNTVNDRPVRILLECILVLSVTYFSFCPRMSKYDENIFLYSNRLIFSDCGISQ